jgi:hypothetical protein
MDPEFTIKFWKRYLEHKTEMSKDHIQTLWLSLTNHEKYNYLKKLRGDYKTLSKIKKELLTKMKTVLKNDHIKFKIISRIKPIISIERKEKYNKILNKPLIINDNIGLTIISHNKNDCYKILNLIIKNFKLRIEKDLKNPEDFFKEPKLIKNTDSTAKNHIFVKIIYNNLPIHIILITKDDVLKVSKARRQYVRYIKNVINKR